MSQYDNDERMAGQDYRPRFVLTLQAEPGNEHDYVSLRRVLKGLLRRHGMRCVDLREVKIEPKPTNEKEG